MRAIELFYTKTDKILAFSPRQEKAEIIVDISANGDYNNYVMIVYLLNINGKNCPEKNLSALAAKKMLRYGAGGNTQRAAQCAFSDLLIGYAAKQHNIGAFTLKETPAAKPYIDGNAFYFSIAHCKNLVILADANEEVGVDCEMLRKVSDNTVRACLNDGEMQTYSEISDEADKIKYFFRCFTEKESYVKFTGQGLSGFPKSIKSYPGCKFITKYVFALSDVFCITVCAKNIESIKYVVVDGDKL